MKKVLLFAATILLLIGMAVGVFRWRVNRRRGADQSSLLKDGLWAISGGVVNGRSMPTTSICRTRASVTHMPAGAEGTTCKVPFSKASGNTTITDIECTHDGTTTKIKETITMVGDGAARTITQSTFTPPLHSRSELTTTADMKYMGPCPAGVEAGDVIFPNGTITHVKQ